MTDTERTEAFVEELTKVLMKAVAKLTPEERDKRLNKLADYVFSLVSGPPTSTTTYGVLETPEERG